MTKLETLKEEEAKAWKAHKDSNLKNHELLKWKWMSAFDSYEEELRKENT